MSGPRAARSARADGAAPAGLQVSPLWSAAEARTADAWTITHLGVPGIVLMEHAGRAVADVVEARGPGGIGSVGTDVVDVVAGPGNNGGDGWVAARHLLGRGVPVRVLATRAPGALRGDAALAAQTCIAAGAALGGLEVVVDGVDGDVVALLGARRGGVVVDALFGTGLSRPLDERSARLVQAITSRRATGTFIVAVDLPSGLPTDGQAPAGDVVVADVTVTFGGQKIAHASEPGFASCGEVVDIDIGVLRPPGTRPAVQRVDGLLLPPPSSTSHKGTWGHVAVVGGAAATAGAAVLAARGALRAGAGLVTILGDVEGVARPAEVMVRPVDDAGVLDGIDVIVVGPGLPPARVASWMPVLMQARARGARVVADAGAIASLPAGLVDVWTPHPGEAARVLGTTSAVVQQDRLAAARALVARLGGVVVLKGAAPVVASSTSTRIVPGGAPALAVGGSGDVLAGVVGAVLAGARGAEVVDELVAAAVFLHQRAGRALVRGALAGEIADAVAVAVADARRGGPPP